MIKKEIEQKFLNISKLVIEYNKIFNDNITVDFYIVPEHNNCRARFVKNGVPLWLHKGDIENKSPEEIFKYVVDMFKKITS